MFGIAIAKTKPLAQGRHREKLTLWASFLHDMHSLNNTEKNQQKKKTLAKEDSNWDPLGQEARDVCEYV